eukprot:4930627-Prymnesium_polylepis.1
MRSPQPSRRRRLRSPVVFAPLLHAAARMGDGRRARHLLAMADAAGVVIDCRMLYGAVCACLGHVAPFGATSRAGRAAVWRRLVDGGGGDGTRGGAA